METLWQSIFVVYLVIGGALLFVTYIGRISADDNADEGMEGLVDMFIGFGWPILIILGVFYLMWKLCKEGVFIANKINL